MERYERMYQWTAASEAFYAPAEIAEGQVIADFGCGPGHAAVEFAKRVGPRGYVHGLDINAEFVTRAKANAKKAGLSERITFHLLQDSRLPLPDAGLDRVVARNTIIYVEDPVFTYREFRRVLRPGGLAHAIEGDWNLTAVEPIPTAEWREVIRAASWAWRRPEIGRKLYGIARRAGFAEVSLQVVTIPDTNGRLRGMIQSVVAYARQSGKLDGEKLDAMLERVNRAMEEGSYLAISPQFLVTART
ncbi:MAG: methyltransferase domain-containing protein [Gammaproteobacteria bacterium]|nr:methyltransferase domain-containing protein [Gammaproteobacteria bacterium]